jgi:murein DD-endopeptidase MepM/ murein hydrolase activator NlpD
VSEAQIDGVPLEPSWSWNLDTQSMPDGEHLLQVLVKDRSLRGNTTTTELRLRTDNTAPQPQVELSPSAPTEGRALVLKIRTTETATLSGTVGDRVLAIQPGSEFSWAIIGFRPDPPQTTVQITITATDEAGNVGTWDQTFDLVRTKYPLEQVELPAEMEPILDPEVRAREDEELQAIYDQVNGPPRWNGTFRTPVTGTVTTVFGIIRTYNAHTYTVHHGGLDFAAGEGEEVHASNDAVVVYTGTLALRGNVVVLDHGAGVYSTYAHLSEVLAKPGDEIQKGDVVALVGGTGLSTGPHTHWEIWAGGDNVDPSEWTEREMP